MSVGLKIYIRGSTARIVATILDFDGTTLIDADADSSTATFYNAAGVVQGTKTLTDITHDSTGVYHTDFIVPAAGDPGNWYVDWYMERGAEPNIGRGYFTVIK